MQPTVFRLLILREFPEVEKEDDDYDDICALALTLLLILRGCFAVSQKVAGDDEADTAANDDEDDTRATSATEVGEGKALVFQDCGGLRGRQRRRRHELSNDGYGEANKSWSSAAGWDVVFVQLLEQPPVNQYNATSVLFTSLVSEMGCTGLVLCPYSQIFRRSGQRRPDFQPKCALFYTPTKMATVSRLLTWWGTFLGHQSAQRTSMRRWVVS